MATLNRPLSSLTENDLASYFHNFQQSFTISARDEISTAVTSAITPLYERQISMQSEIDHNKSLIVKKVMKTVKQMPDFVILKTN